MKSKKRALKVISKKLEGIPWAVFGGTAVEIYTKGERRGNDIDIVVPPDKIEVIGKIFGKKPVTRTRKKDRVQIIGDTFVETEIEGVPVEFVGKTEKIIVDSHRYDTGSEAMENLFARVETKRYLGVEIKVVPVAEVLVQKMIFDRSGKWQDREDVKMLAGIGGCSKKDLVRAARRWGVSSEKEEEFLRVLLKNDC